MNKASALRWHHKSNHERRSIHDLCHYSYYFSDYYYRCQQEQHLTTIRQQMEKLKTNSLKW